MLLHEPELKDAAELVAKAEKDLGQFLTEGQITDLVADNRLLYDLDKCKAIAKSLCGSGTVGQFHRALAKRTLG